METFEPIKTKEDIERKKKMRKKLLAYFLIFLAVFVGAYFSFRQIARSMLKDIIREQTTINSKNNSETTIFDEKVLIYTDKNDSNVKAISESELRAMSPEDREKALNSTINSAANISNITGITDSGDGSGFKPIISDGIISGVSTGTGVLINNSSSTPSNSVDSAEGNMQDEIDRIRNGIK